MYHGARSGLYSRMSIISQILGFVRVLRTGVTQPTGQVSTSFARTLKETTHVRGGPGGLARAGTEKQHQIVAKGHKNYTDSFKQ